MRFYCLANYVALCNNTKTLVKPLFCKESLAQFVLTLGEPMSVSNAQKTITQTLISWEGVSTAPHRFGGVEYLLGTRELGHIHGDHLVDIPFPKKVRDEVVNARLAEPHHILPETGWISFYLRQEDDVQKVIALLRRSYEIAVKQKQRH
jgi:predicted DNA-binding protein (MmcQ/YjbR family)